MVEKDFLYLGENCKRTSNDVQEKMQEIFTHFKEMYSKLFAKKEINMLLNIALMIG